MILRISGVLSKRPCVKLTFYGIQLTRKESFLHAVQHKGKCWEDMVAKPLEFKPQQIFGSTVGPRLENLFATDK